MGERMTDQEREAAIEKAQIEWVFGLTGGELETEPWVYWTQMEHSDGTLMFGPESKDEELWPGKKFESHLSGMMEWHGRYWYEGPPDYASIKGPMSMQIRTLVQPGGMLSAPHRELYDGDGVWRLKATYASSGETECPGRHKDGGKLVTEAEAAGSLRTDWPPDCPLCEAAVGEEHGYIYLGDGGYEAVYVLERQVSDEDYRRRAREQYSNLGRYEDAIVEVDAAVRRSGEFGNPKFSRGDGAYVQAWLWIEED